MEGDEPKPEPREGLAELRPAQSRPELRSAPRRAGQVGLLMAVAVGASFFILGLWLHFGPNRRPEAADAPSHADDRPAAMLRARPEEVAAGLRETPEGSGLALPDRAPHAAMVAPAAPARLALVIDDLGRSLETLDRLRDLGVPVTYAVLPFESRTTRVVETLRERGEEYLCHLPMEGTAGNDPGPGALRSDMTSNELTAATRGALDAVPGAVGVNNHMGSVLSANEVAMRRILGVVRERGLYFVDSRTTAESRGFEVAADLGVAAVERRVFLDGERSAAAIESEFRRAIQLASEDGEVVVIGHPYPETLEVLERLVPEAVDGGFVFVHASALVRLGS